MTLLPNVAAWTAEQVQLFLREMGVPEDLLQGFATIDGSGARCYAPLSSAKCLQGSPALACGTVCSQLEHTCALALCFTLLISLPLAIPACKGFFRRRRRLPPGTVTTEEGQSPIHLLQSL